MAKQDATPTAHEYPISYMVRVPLVDVVDNPFQHRTYHDEAIAQLAESIERMRDSYSATSGLVQVPTGRLIDSQGGPLSPASDPALWPEGARVQLATGHRRLRAFMVLSDKYDDCQTMPVFLVDLSDQDMAVSNYTENEDREDQSAIELARTLEGMSKSFKWSHEKLAEKIGRSRSHVTNLLRLLNLSKAAQKAIENGVMSARHGRELLVLKAIPGAYKRLGRDYQSIGQLSVSDLQGEIATTILQMCRSMSEATWPEGWTPESDAQPVVGACEGCKHAISYKKKPRCSNKDCFAAKLQRHLVEVTGPKEARAMFDQTPTEYKLGSVATWRSCSACRRSPAHLEGVVKDTISGWFIKQGAISFHRAICPDCVQRAGLKIVEAPAESGDASDTVTDGARVVASARSVESSTTPATTPAQPARELPKLTIVQKPKTIPYVLVTMRISPPTSDTGEQIAQVTTAREGKTTGMVDANTVEMEAYHAESATDLLDQIKGQLAALIDGQRAEHDALTAETSDEESHD